MAVKGDGSVCPVSLESFYEINHIASLIHSHGFRRTALQFPDTLLRDAPAVCSALQRRLRQCGASECLVFVLGDTAYGACSVDEVAAQHYGADSLVHYGPSCQSVTAHGLPVLWVFGRAPIDAAQLIKQMDSNALFSSPCLLIYDVGYHHALSELLDAMPVPPPSHTADSDGSTMTIDANESSTPFDVAVAVPRTSLHLEQEGEGDAREADGQKDSVVVPLQVANRRVCAVRVRDRPSDSGEASPGRRDLQPLSVRVAPVSPDHSPESAYLDSLPCLDSGQLQLVCIAEDDSPLVTRILKRHGNTHKIWQYSPVRGTLCEVSSHSGRLLMRRYRAVEAVRTARVIGLVYGTVALQHHRKLHDRLKRLIRSAGRQVLSLVVGKLSVAKLGNFPEVEAFCHMASPEDPLTEALSKDLPAPVCTPYELEVALGVREWDGRYMLEFAELIDSIPFPAIPTQTADTHTVEHSLIGRGTIREFHTSANGTVQGAGGGGEAADEQLMVKGEGVLSVGLASVLVPYTSRSFKGVEPLEGLDAPRAALEGQRGIAAGYEDELPAAPVHTRTSDDRAAGGGKTAQTWKVEL